ncbi:DUF72 domain-containing protein [Hymenobacter weizhouensis]|uniref:DUF72 domain-containing protein n=1 Tax=Hymenobacter sp. YIM 151500-1 TaxID=2987689 RepID=UPI002226D026|nr:DUF72 domain-containing protein [Hymenobacter sp. YIM 151500-1]UYZ61591.1 DUF72 domain-containing protein [Hymenobacter sp. YIM 151500-1]
MQQTPAYHIGCSGYHYRHWRGRFYPEKLPVRRWFEFYSQHFDTLELNVTFYRFPQQAMLDNWYQASRPGFVFAVKAPRLITHYNQFNQVGGLLTDFYDIVQAGLQEKLGPVLFQLPPRAAYTPERLARILEYLNPAFQNVLEFRHPSWWQPAVYEALAGRGVSFCGQSHPALPDAVVATAPLLYYRLHGVPNLYQSPYDEEFLARLTAETRAAGAAQAFVYFNNDIDASAIGNARRLQELVG